MTIRSTIKQVDKLSGPELALIKQFCMANKVIAKNLAINKDTAKKRIERLCEKFGVENRTAAVVKAIQLGFIDMYDFDYRDHNE